MSSKSARLEYLRWGLRNGTISYSELYELQSLAEYIDPGDVELLEAAGCARVWGFTDNCDCCVR